MLYSEADLRRIFSKAYLDRGRALTEEGHVLEVQQEAPNKIRSAVLGSRSGEYRQQITLFPTPGPFRIEGHCNCPVGFNCKHTAAVMLTLLQTEGKSVDRASAEAKAPASLGDPTLDTWLQKVRTLLRPGEDQYPPSMRQRVVFIISPLTKAGREMVVVEARTAGLRPDGEYGPSTELRMGSVFSGSFPKCALEVDRKLIEGMHRNLESPIYPTAAFALAGAEAPRFLNTLLATGRCHYLNLEGEPLKLCPSRPVEFAWQMEPDGDQVFTTLEEGLLLIPSIPPYAINPETSECWPIQTDTPAELLAELLQAPPIAPEYSVCVAEALAEIAPTASDLLPKPVKPAIQRPAMPDPILHVEVRLFDRHEPIAARRKLGPAKQVKVIAARIEYDYDGVRVGPRHPGMEATPLRKMVGDQLYLIKRLPGVESDFESELYESGWAPISSAHVEAFPSEWATGFAFLGNKGEPSSATQRRFDRWVIEVVPRLRENGWLVHIEGEREVVRSESVTWDMKAEADGADWFSLSLGVVVEGVRYDLRPILIEALAQLGQIGIDDVKTAGDDIELFPKLPDGRVLLITVGRIRPIVETLTQLFGSVPQWVEDPNFHATQADDTDKLNELAEAQGLKWKEPERLAEVRSRLEALGTIPTATPPADFQGELRPYQLQGLGWFQLLGRLGFGGVLADDMGLGKTVQTLAHLSLEKDQSGLKEPALIVAPKSTIPNWRHELAKFAPNLRVLTLQGQERKSHFSEIADHDVVLTSYALLGRDREPMEAQQFSVVVLDEAQNIKNHRANVSQAAYQLKARQRICLSGTPIENRLDELWSLFHFLMPGLLGSASAFKRDYATAIESQQDQLAKDRLARKIRPFVLRRTKEKVAPELPAKTEVIERVELGDAQRDLYETLRLAMDKRVRELFATKGLEKSRIEVLDALLKLRQACCDPRLVKLPAAKGVKDSAKLDRLIEMICELLDEGRHILLFSQFTSMLDLIEKALAAEDRKWVRISGDTEDRDTPVKRFQSGEVPLFLISLRAGGTGLNLTAADTVIHYDPWWNPAVEAQATDRAHRIGQEKQVFVYKLVAEGTVEEKILELQAQKAALAKSVLEDSEDPIGQLSVDDFLEVFSESGTTKA